MAGNTFTLDDLKDALPVAPAKPASSEGRIAAEQLAEGPLREVVQALPWAQAATGFAPLFGLPSGYDVNQEQALTAARSQLGLSGEESKYFAGRALGAGIRALTNPATYPQAALFGLTGPLAALSTSATSAAGSEAGGEIGGSLGPVGGFLGSVGGGVAGGALPIPMIMSAVPKLFNAVKTAWNKAPSITEEAVTAAGSKRGANLAAKAMASDTTLGGKLLRSEEIKNITGVELPVLAATEGSPVLGKAVQSQAARDTGFLGYIRNKEEQAKQDLVSYALKQYGEPSTERILKAAEPSKAPLKNLQNQLDTIDGELANMGSKLESVDPTMLANRTTNLLKAREKIAQEQVGPLYETALDDAAKAGIELSPNQTEALYSFANNSINADIFKTFPSIYSKVISKFAPEVLEDGTEVFKSASVRDLDSLKREVNKALYTQNMSNDTRRVVLNMRNAVNDVIDELPASFKDPYRGADAAFLSKVKVPFSARAVDDIGGKAFVEQAVPVLTKYPSGLQQFLDVAGEDGVPLVRDAFMYSLGKTRGILKEDGSINPKSLEQFIRSNKDTLKLVPNVESELRNIASDSRGLVEARAKVTEAIDTENQNIANSLFTNVFKRGLDTVYGEFLTKPAMQQQILSELKKNPEASDGFKAYVLSNFSKSGKTLDTFMENKQSLEALFGKDYLKNVEAIAEASQRMYEHPTKLSVPVSTAYKTKFEETVGMSPESAASLARRQVSSVFNKVATAYSKYFANNASKAENIEIQKLLKNPQNIADTAKILTKAVDETDPAKLKELSIQLGKVIGAEVSTRALFGSMSGAEKFIYNGANVQVQPAPAAPGQAPQQTINVDEMNFVPANPITR